MAYILVNSITMVFLFTLFINELVKSKAVYFIWCFTVFFCEVAMVILIVIMQIIFLYKHFNFLIYYIYIKAYRICQSIWSS